MGTELVMIEEGDMIEVDGPKKDIMYKSKPKIRHIVL